MVVFNELQYHPTAAQTEGEWIELHSQHAVDVDLSGWRLDGGVDFVFPAGTTIPGGGYLIIAANPGAFTAAKGVAALGPFTSVLTDGGESVTLKNKNGRLMDEINYNDRFPWPVAADGSGATLSPFSTPSSPATGPAFHCGSSSFIALPNASPMRKYVSPFLMLAAHYAPASPYVTGFIYSPDTGKTWAQYDLKGFGPRSGVRFHKNK